MVRIWYFHCSGLSSIPAQETEISYVMWFGKKKKKGNTDKSSYSQIAIMRIE